MTPAPGRVVAVIQARMGSARLPGKVLADVGGRPMLETVLRRVRPAGLVAEWVVATSDAPADAPVAALAGRVGVACVRGSEDDVLDRFHLAVRGRDAEVVARLTGDNPFVDAGFVDRMVGEYAQGGCDYLAPAAGVFPVGLSVEVFAAAALEAAWREDADPAGREHVTPFLYRNPDRFRVRRVADDRADADLRLTVDAPEDLALARRVFAHFGHDRFGWEEAVAVLRANPDWRGLNRHVGQRTL